METTKALISIIIPVLNEEQNIPLAYKGLLDVWKKLEGKYDYEIIFVNDGSEDKSGEAVENLVKSDAKIKYVEFSRNFGKELATSAGLYYAKGDAVMIIDADLQHPIDLIPEFIKKWESGTEVVVGVRKESGKKSIIKKIGSYLFYKIINSVGDTKIIPYSTDYCLLDKKVVVEFNKFTEKNRITRGLIAWLGFRRDYVYFDAGQRNYGKARYNYFGLIKLAVSTLVGHSLFPLKVAGYFGTFMTLFFGFVGFLIFIDKYLMADSWGISVSNNTIFAIIILFSVGIILASLGLMALYIANIQSEVVGRPMYVIRSKKL